MYKFNSELLKGCHSPEAKKDRREFLTAHLEAFKLLRHTVECAIKEAQESHISDGYDSPAWAYKQADLNGQIRAYTRMLEILTVNEDNHV